MSLLAGLVQRGGHPAAVRPTIPLPPGEKEYASFLADVDDYHSAEVDLASGIFAADGLFFAAAGPDTGETGWQWRGRKPVVVTSRRLVLDDTDHEFRSLITIQPDPLDFAVTLFFQGAQPIKLRGPWVPWMTVVLCAELFGTAWPPGHSPLPDVRLPGQRVGGTTIKTMCENLP